MYNTPTELIEAWDGASGDVRDALATFGVGTTIGMELVSDLMTPPVTACRACHLELADIRLSPALRSPRTLTSAHADLARRVRVAISDGLHASDLRRATVDRPTVSRVSELAAMIADQHRVANLLRDYAAL